MTVYINFFFFFVLENSVDGDDGTGEYEIRVRHDIIIDFVFVVYTIFLFDFFVFFFFVLPSLASFRVLFIADKPVTFVVSKKPCAVNIDELDSYVFLRVYSW